ncbi:MAG: four helix bundle protein [Candidatus Nealsonbacteria bacterium CG23_combo_of_CG06-09_8_20_14_all_40_13]|uniref:Four helix bundle protein n=1 Tax=Candidatus Nealsonbacteria bacterium CG23_combo_of_CG06-09_8_20_14_all_40_13 TaxID=1974724 RepID=A0A2G9YRK9_9BACT|nr:MAG: four helix bundle protein [Candidatus Nealsonbacteria bacterium CG23_combo_of_CG06-09_8_20_14_all_40_13]PIR70725.1 MAG: four helix bundle protein [Candidatus Nealsonbacteria bacterium CG10_big_fil_rev_8_21_14_0_10_40_24]PIU43213.1 MAG: four helix bundle protein [Candidatus Nealsonbacteria bacterium CG07_land_8_20_14_0_80_40_10]
MYKFEKLKVWDESLKLIKLVYSVIKELPLSERYGLADQLRRSAISISLNLAEGCGTGTDKEFKFFLRISVKSQYETVAGLMIIKSLYSKINIAKVLRQAETVGKMLHGLIRSLSKNQ